jgi:peptide/nickel transport system substrate-binding protein
MTEDTLVTYRRVAGIEGVELVPDLAAALPLVSDGGRTYAFRLRRGLRYSNGRRVSPQDIRHEIERLFTINSPAIPGGYFGDIVGADRCRPHRSCDLSRGIAVDDPAGTITFHLTRPDGSFLAQLALPFAAAVPAGVSGTTFRSERLPATGPYEVASYRPQRSLTLVRNPRFRQWSVDAQPAGYPDRIVFTLRLSGLGGPVLAHLVEAGRADVAPDLISPPLPERQLEDLLAREPSRLHLDATPSTHFFFLNTRVAPFDNVRVRRAVNDALDRQAFVRMLGPGYSATCHILPPDFPSYERGCPYGDGGAAAVTRAIAVIRAAGDTGKPVTVWAFHVFAREAMFVSSLLDELGFRSRVKVLPQNPDEYFRRIDDSRTRAQIGWFGWSSDFPSENGFLLPLVRCSAWVEASPQATFDPSGYCDRRVDRLLAQAAAAAATDPVAAPMLWRKAERLVLADAPFVPTTNPDNVALVGKRVGNYEYNPQYGVLLDQLWVR